MYTLAGFVAVLAQGKSHFSCWLPFLSILQQIQTTRGNPPQISVWWTSQEGEIVFTTQYRISHFFDRMILFFYLRFPDLCCAICGYQSRFTRLSKKICHHNKHKRKLIKINDVVIVPQKWSLGVCLSTYHHTHWYHCLSCMCVRMFILVPA